MIRNKWLAGILVASLVTVLGVGCEQSSYKPVKMISSEDRDENGWPLYRVKQEGFAISLPPDWQQLDMDPAQFEANIRPMLQKNPELNNTLNELRRQKGAGIKFFGFEEAAMNTTFATNVTVIRTRNPRAYTLDEMDQINLKELEESEAVTKPVFHERTKVVAGDAVRYRFTMNLRNPRGKPFRIQATSFAYLKGNDCFEVTMVTLPERYQKNEPGFLKIGQSFRLLQ